MADSRAARDNETRIHLPGEFINPPYAVVLDDFAGRIERQAVQPAESFDLIPSVHGWRCERPSDFYAELAGNTTPII
jgi:hypothetical protein